MKVTFQEFAASKAPRPPPTSTTVVSPEKS